MLQHSLPTIRLVSASPHHDHQRRPHALDIPNRAGKIEPGPRDKTLVLSVESLKASVRDAQCLTDAPLCESRSAGWALEGDAFLDAGNSAVLHPEGVAVLAGNWGLALDKMEELRSHDHLVRLGRVHVHTRDVVSRPWSLLGPQFFEEPDNYVVSVELLTHGIDELHVLMEVASDRRQVAVVDRKAIARDGITRGQLVLETAEPFSYFITHFGRLS